MVTTDGGLIRKRCGPAKSAARRRLAAAREILKDYAEKGLPKDESLKQRMQYELRRIQDGKEKILKIEKDHEELLGTLNEEEVEEELKAWAEIYDGEEGLGELLMNLGDVEIEMELALPLESVPESREGYRMDSDGGKQERRDRSPEVLIVEEEDGRQKERSQEMTAMEKRTGREAVEEPETPRKLRYARLPELTIKPFDGTPTDFIQFWQSFKANIDDQPIAKVTKMEYLKSLLIGKAYKAVEGYIISEENYESCLERLRERFEDNEVITEQLIRQLNEIATIGEGVDERRRVLDEIHSTIRQLENMDHAIDTIQTRNLVLNKFKKSYRLRVMETLENAGKTLSVKNVLQCLEKMVKREEKDEQIYQSNKAYLQAGSRNIRENPIGRNQEFSPGNKQIKGIWTSSKTMERPRSYPPKKVDINNCPFCHQEHRAEECTVMVTPQERAAIIKRSGKCYNCLQEGHQYQKCEEHTCSRCNKKHHIALCLRTEKKVTFEDQRSSVMSSLIDKEKDPKATGLMTARVEVQNPEKQIKFKAVVLMDTGAERSYISNKLAGLLKLKSNVKELVSVEAFGGRNENYESEVVEVEIQTNEGPVKILMNKVRTIINSPVEISQIEGVKKEDKKKDDKKEKIDLLIGGFDVWKFVKNGTEVEPGKVLIESSVGNFVLKKNLKENSITNLAIDGFTKEEQENWNLEIMERNKKKGEDEKALEIFDETTEFINNRYMVRIPWKKENKPLAKNFGLAYGQLKSMVRKLKSNEERLKDYDGIIKQQLRENIIEESPKEEGIFPTYYIPHHAVFKDQSETTRIRIVNNCSAKSLQGTISLNEAVMQGPDQLPKIIGILLRSQLTQFIMSGDIEKAFHQIMIHPEDRDSLRFIWLKDIQKPVDEKNGICYRFCRVPFGLKTSPYLLTNTIKKHISKLKRKEEVERNLYMDNLFIFGEEEENMIEIRKELQDHFQIASMILREWFVNSEKVQESIEEKFKKQGQEVKILGLEWDRTKDQFIVALPKEIPIIQTKRTVLRTLMKIHDPLGWTTPVTVELKAVVNEVVNRHKKWDEPVEKEEERRFNNAMEKIVNKEVEVKRWIHGMKMREKIEVHIFTDATPHIFAAAAYIRVSCENGTLAKLIMAKNRIRKSGTKETIPRMELKAVTLGSRLMDIIEEELGKKIKKRFIWTDSQIVLSWVKKAPQDKVINNRLKELENKEICYGYVESKENPADLPTRGCKPEELKKNNLWWFGPKWLKSEEDLEKRATIKIDNTPRATVISLAGKEQSQAGIELNWEKVGTLRKAETIATWILKAIKKFLRSIKKEPQTKILKEISEGEIEMEDLKIASMWLIKEEQRRWLSEKPPEIGIMEDDIWVLRDRLGKMENYKKLIIIPRNSELTKLIIMEVHRRLKHSGTERTLAELRTQYWIQQGRRMVRKMIKKCSDCRRRNAIPFELPKFPKLPEERVRRSTPFEHTGLDFFGPIQTKEKGLTTKKWVLILTCLTTRAVFLQMVNGLDVETFIQAIRKFVARRGLPKKIISDNARTFKASEAVLNKMIQEWNESEQVQEYLKRNRIKWNFIIERAPWKGGVYERLIGIVKDALRRTNGRRIPNSEELDTFMTEVEAILNNRPITYMAAEEIEVLRPSDLLGPGTPCTLLPTWEQREEKEDPSYIPAPGREDLIGQLKENLAKLEKFWEIWQGRYLNLLRERTQWLMKQGRGRSKKEPKEGQIVIVFDENRPREFWNLARIEKVIQSGDGEGRAAEIKTQHGTTRRALNHLFALEVDEERMAGEEEKMAGEADSSGLAPNVAASEGPGTKA